MDGDVDAVVKVLMESESRYKDNTQQYEQHYERWTSLSQV